MGKVDAPYLTWRGKGEPRRWYFQPASRDRAQGWTALRLHDANDMPIADELAAVAACRPLAEIYSKWRQKVPGYGPHMIDQLGRVVKPKRVEKTRKEIRTEALKHDYRPGQVGAMVADYFGHDVYLRRKPKTQLEYKSYLGMLVEKFGDKYWQDITAGAAREWIVERARLRGRSGAHALYRTCRAFFGKMRLVYTVKGHPGIVPAERNPFLSLDLSMPMATLIVWPRDAVDTFVALADELGQPSMGDAVIMMAWLGTRKQDWLKWPATHFDKPLLAFRQEKTGRPLVLPWSMIPALDARVAAAKARRADKGVSASTFFHDREGRPWRDADAFRDAFNVLRTTLAERYPSFATRYYVGVMEEDPLRLPTALLTMRAMRHTCITLMHDARIPRDLMPSISGHEPTTIDEVLAHYTASTADQAAAALTMRIDHEAKGAKA
jgi:hypothetical protein